MIEDKHKFAKDLLKRVLTLLSANEEKIEEFKKNPENASFDFGSREFAL